MSKLNPTFLVIVSVVLIFQCVPFAAFADNFDLSYSLTEGGYRLELDAASPYKGLNLAVNSDVSCRYEIIQRIIMPIANRDKPASEVGQNFVMRGLRGSNKYGDLRVPSNDSPVRQDEVIYVSDASGTADSFTLIFGVARTDELVPGNYFGRIGFTLNPIGAARSPVTKFLDVYVTVTAEGTLATQIEISTSTGSKNIVLNPKREEMRSADILVKINRRSNRQFSIIQFLTQAFESEDGNRLDYEVLDFVVKEAKKGNSVNKATALSPGLQEIYISSAGGEADEYFIISYGLKDLSGQRAGRFRSRMQYLMEEAGFQSKLDAIGIEIENERQFDLVITPSDQRYAIEFLNVKPNEPAQKSELVIEVLTNIGRRYQVSQEVNSELTSAKGKIIPQENFTLRTEGIDSTKGVLRFSANEAVKKGSTVLFVSDSLGSPDKFRVIYELESPQDLEAGDYSTRITYSLLEI